MLGYSTQTVGFGCPDPYGWGPHDPSTIGLKVWGLRYGLGLRG